jgi:hypothetical protein
VERVLLYTENEYTVWKFTGVPADVVDFFKRIRWGSEGAVYERKNINELLPLLHQANLVAVYKGDEIQATAIFCKSDVTVNGEHFVCEYIRYFAASDEIRGRKLIKHFAGKVMALVREGEQSKTIYIGCVEKGNIRSYKVVENAGYKPIGVLTVNAFSRFFPKADTRITRVTSVLEMNEVMKLLDAQYKHHALVHFNYIFLNDNYFVIRDRGEIVAGCQFHRAQWKINQMPGLSGKIIMNVLPITPLINKIFNPTHFEFLAIEGIYFMPGHENTLHQLIEGLLYQEKLNSALFWFAEDCPYRKAILANGNLGLLHQFVKKSGTFVMASYKNMTDEEIKLVESHPQFASAFDYI